MLEEFKKLPIWKQFVDTNTDNYNIDNLANNALSLLEEYRLAFPKYTLHNRVHLKNVLNVIGRLLGDRVKKLSCLECILIILSVFYHDIGMVFKAEDLQKITGEESFNKFLEDHYGAKLIYKENASVLNDDLAEWYSRWMHAKRVWLFLDDFKSHKWGNINLKDSIGNICESHNSHTKTLIDDKLFPTNFLSKADVKFCAVLLRLGDILDFDNSRTPKSVYKLLDLDNPKTYSEKISKQEWDKHLCSDGFEISNEPNLLDIKFIAGPEHPQIEKNINSFLDAIEDEFKNCNSIIEKRSKRWQDFKLPDLIDRIDIKSENYKKGDYKLSLNENKIIELLVGESLYVNDFVFIRELLQNAIDTSRMREYHEHSKGNTAFKAKPIEVSTWIDKDGYRWIRVDDYGMGINEYVLTNHLLKKGNSFYKSDYFKLQKLNFKEKIDKDFTPISRFGIGLLSCFIIGDAIQLNTRAVNVETTNNHEEKIRLSIEGLQGQYTVQTEKDNHVPNSMPCKNGLESGFRREEGTSIAVRIDRVKDHIGLEETIKMFVSNYICCSPVEVKFENENIDFPFEATLNTPLAEYAFIPFDEQQKKEIENVIGTTLNTVIGLEIIPINITEASKNENLKGQLVLLKVKCESFPESIDFKISIYLSEEKTIKFSKGYFSKENNRHEDKVYSINIKELFNQHINLPKKNNLKIKDVHREIPFWQNNLIRLTHNGISIPNRDNIGYRRDVKIGFSKWIFSNKYKYRLDDDNFGYFGLIYFQDKLLPDLSVSRDIINGLNFSIYSSLYYSLSGLNEYAGSTNNMFNFFEITDDYFNFIEIKNDEHVKNGLWDDQKIIRTELFGFLSVGEIKEKSKTQEIRIDCFNVNPFMTALTKGLIQLNFEVEYNNTYYCPFIVKGVKQKTDGVSHLDKLQPLLFVPFNDSIFISISKYINSIHPLAQWMIANQAILIENHYGYFLSLVRFIFDKRIEGINEIVEHFEIVLPSENKPKIPKISESDFLEIKYYDDF